MLTRTLLTSLGLTALFALPASADAISRQKLTEILKDPEVANNPTRLLHAIGSQNLTLDRGEMIGALTGARAPAAARAILSVAESLESRNGQVKMERLIANGTTGPDGKIYAFNSDLNYRVNGRDLEAITGLHVAPDGRSSFRSLTEVKDAQPKPPEPAPEPEPVIEEPKPDPEPVITEPRPEDPRPTEPQPNPVDSLPDELLALPETPAEPRRDTVAPGSLGIDNALRASLGMGARGDQVRAMQERLNAHRTPGSAALSEDGKLGKKTEDAIKDFQRRNGLPVTGVVDDATRKALEADPPLRNGDQGQAVTDLQKKLNEAGAGLDPDGKFGKKTEDALRDFQRRSGLPQTGVLDEATRKALENKPDATTPVSSDAELARGAEGDDVTALQRKLNEHRRAQGKPPIDEDGKFGAATEQALKDFQSSQGLDQTGTANSATNAELAKTPEKPKVSRGDTGQPVTDLQKELNKHLRAQGQPTIREDGKFGKGTEDALKAFQRANGLPETGVLDQATQDALRKTPQAAPTLKPGDEGERVRQLQKDLNKHRLANGKPAISEDGKFGPGTEQALEDFQSASGLPATGEADPATQSAAATAPTNGSNEPTNASQSELEVLARIVKGECPATVPWEGKVAVAAVVLNRVRSSRFPNSIRGVAHQPKQFSCYNSNVRQRLYYGPIPDYAWRAARAALAGQDPSRGATYYFNPHLVRPSWARRLTFIRRIGTTRTTTHDFYK